MCLPSQISFQKLICEPSFKLKVCQTKRNGPSHPWDLCKIRITYLFTHTRQCFVFIYLFLSNFFCKTSSSLVTLNNRQETFVLQIQVLDTQATFILWLANCSPFDQSIFLFYADHFAKKNLIYKTLFCLILLLWISNKESMNIGNLERTKLIRTTLLATRFILKSILYCLPIFIGVLCFLTCMGIPRYQNGKEPLQPKKTWQCTLKTYCLAPWFFTRD